MELPKTGDLLLGKYRLEKPLGEGGMGVVYAARHDLLGQRVAVKLIRPEFATHAEAASRFLNEARAAARIENEHVARVLDVGTLETGLPYMVLEYLEGADLAHVLQERGPLPVADFADYLLQAIEAVAHAHALGIIHRDLKPSNLFLARRPDGLSRVKVLDFGIAKVLGGIHGSNPSMTRTNAMVGSPLYMSPEQLLNSKNVGHLSDIWALGVVAYELLTGRPPFTADNPVALFAAIQVSDPTSMCASRPEVGEQLDAIIMKCLRRVPEERFSSVTELASCLVPFGTVIGASAFENSKRILPLEASSPPPQLHPQQGSKPPETPGTSMLPAQPAQPASLPVGPTPLFRIAASTAEPWSSSPPSPPLQRSRVPVILGVVALLAAALVAMGIAIFPRATHQPLADTRTGIVGSPVTANTDPGPSPSSALPSESRVPVDAPIAQPTPTTITIPATTRPHTTPPPNDVAGAATTTRPKAPGLAPAPSARPNCNPPYEFDATGRKIWKRECP